MPRPSLHSPDSQPERTFMERRAVSRASLACLPCRDQHLKCDASHPICGRCRSLSKSCSFPESRRSGKHRKAATWKTQRAAIALNSQEISTPSETVSLGDYGLPTSSELGASPSPLPLMISKAQSNNNNLLDLYFDHFHPSHPFVLPYAALQARIHGYTQSSTLGDLVAVMEYIGSFYSQPFLRHEMVLQSQTQNEIDGFMVQFNLLMALAKSMCDDRPASEELLSKAIKQARSIGMHKRAFAEAISGNDPVLAESWRRTWWMLCVTDANFSIIRQDFVTIIGNSDHDVDLPCEEDTYRRLEVPTQSCAFSEYQNREYALEDKPFSSFAYFIDAIQIFTTALKASNDYRDISEAEILCDDIEARVIGWFLLLPLAKRELPVTPGLMDQLMFQAHMMMYTSLAFIHRPLSNLLYDPAESISSCGPLPPPLDPGLGYFANLANHKTHSEKLLQAIRKQNQCLLLLPMRAAQMSPFVICMVACCTIGYLVAYKLAFRNEEAEAARSRIRVSLATLKHYEHIWPRAKKILMELKRIAQSILQSRAVTSATNTPLEPLVPQGITAINFFDKDWLYAFDDTSAS